MEKIMSDVQINNKVFLSGKVITNPVFTHEVMGEGFYEVMLAVKRMSEQEDVIPVTLSERLMIDNEIRVGDTLSVDGQFRSYNKYENGKSRLMLTVFTREIADDDEERNPNIIELTGYVCKPTVYRTTPFKRDIEVFFVFCHKIIIYNSVNKSSVFSFENFNGTRRARRQPHSTTRFAD